VNMTIFLHGEIVAGAGRIAHGNREVALLRWQEPAAARRLDPAMHTGTVEDRRECGIGLLRYHAKDKQQRRTEDREWYARHQ